MAAVDDFETIGFEVEDHVATLTLRRPEQLNSFNERMANEVAQAWKRTPMMTISGLSPSRQTVTVFLHRDRCRRRQTVGS